MLTHWGRGYSKGGQGGLAINEGARQPLGAGSHFLTTRTAGMYALDDLDGCLQETVGPDMGTAPGCQPGVTLELAQVN